MPDDDDPNKPDWCLGMAQDILSIPLDHPDRAERFANVIWFLHCHGGANTLESLASALEDDGYDALAAGILPPKGQPVPLDALLRWMRSTAAALRGESPETLRTLPHDMLDPSGNGIKLDPVEAIRRLTAPVGRGGMGLPQRVVGQALGHDQPWVSNVLRGRQKVRPADETRLRATYPEAFRPPPA